MSVAGAELTQVVSYVTSLLGVGKLPLYGGSAGVMKTIAQTMPFECAVTATTPGTGVMDLTPIYLVAGTLIANINYVSGSTAETGGTHLWYAIYDDGRGSATANQLSLLGQTADNTGATAFAANTNLGAALATPYTTTYTGIYYLAFMCAESAGTMPTLAGVLRASTAAIQISTGGTGAVYGGTAGSSLTTTAPNPSGAVTATGRTQFAYVS